MLDCLETLEFGVLGTGVDIFGVFGVFDTRAFADNLRAATPGEAFVFAIGRVF